MTDYDGFICITGNIYFAETAGLALNSLSRAELMQKLAARRTDVMEDNPPPRPEPAAP